MTSSPIKVLFLAANPRDKTRLALDKELREIAERVRASRYRDRIQLISEWAVRPRDLQDKLLWHQPHIVHFSGHGLSDQILLMDDRDKAVPVSGQALRRMFATLKDNIHVVVFNACFSNDQARAVTDSIDTAIGMHKAMGDRSAVAFAAAFYMALGHGRSIQNAFDIGVNELVLHNARFQHEPVLHTRDGVDASQIVLVAPDEPAGNSGPHAAAVAGAPAAGPARSGPVVQPVQDFEVNGEAGGEATPVTPGRALSRGDMEKALTDLFKRMFSPRELYQFLRHTLGSDVADEMPSPDGASSKALYAAEVAEKLMDRGKVKAPFLRAWAEAREEHAAEIYALMPSAAPPRGNPVYPAQESAKNIRQGLTPMQQTILDRAAEFELQDDSASTHTPINHLYLAYPPDAKKSVWTAVESLSEAGSLTSKGHPDHAIVNLTPTGLLLSNQAHAVVAIAEAILEYLKLRLQAEGIRFSEHRWHELKSSGVARGQEEFQPTRHVIRILNLWGGSMGSGPNEVAHYGVPHDIVDFRNFTGIRDIYMRAERIHEQRGARPSKHRALVLRRLAAMTSTPRQVKIESNSD